MGLLAVASLVGPLAAVVGGTGVVGLLPAAGFVVVLTLGEMLAAPFARDAVARLARDRRLGTYYGLLSSVSGLGVLVGSTAVGALVGVGATTGPAAALPWVALAGWCGVGGVLAVTVLRRQAPAAERPVPWRPT